MEETDARLQKLRDLPAGPFRKGHFVICVDSKESWPFPFEKTQLNLEKVYLVQDMFISALGETQLCIHGVFWKANRFRPYEVGPSSRIRGVAATTVIMDDVDMSPEDVLKPVPGLIDRLIEASEPPTLKDKPRVYNDEGAPTRAIKRTKHPTEKTGQVGYREDTLCC